MEMGRDAGDADKLGEGGFQHIHPSVGLQPQKTEKEMKKKKEGRRRCPILYGRGRGRTVEPTSSALWHTRLLQIQPSASLLLLSLATPSGNFVPRPCRASAPPLLRAPCARGCPACLFIDPGKSVLPVRPLSFLFFFWP